MDFSNPKLYLVNINAFTKIGKTLPIPSQESKLKCNSDLNLGP